MKTDKCEKRLITSTSKKSYKNRHMRKLQRTFCYDSITFVTCLKINSMFVLVVKFSLSFS